MIRTGLDKITVRPAGRAPGSGARQPVPPAAPCAGTGPFTWDSLRASYAVTFPMNVPQLFSALSVVGVVSSPVNYTDPYGPAAAAV